MSDVLLFERAGSSFPETLARRGHHVVYRANSLNHCPGCGRSQWYVGRITAECGFCGVAVPLAEARVSRSNGLVRLNEAGRANKRRFARLPGNGRELQLLINGSPTSFALQNISAGGLMGNLAAELSPGTEVFVRFEDGNAVPAVVKWSDGELVGLAFSPSASSGAS
jgi:hypothetical protein